MMKIIHISPFQLDIKSANDMKSTNPPFVDVEFFVVILLFFFQGIG